MLYYPNDLESYTKVCDQYIRDSIKTKENLLELVEYYHQHGKPIWQQQSNRWCDRLTLEKLAKEYHLKLERYKVFTPECGHERILFSFIKE